MSPSALDRRDMVRASSLFFKKSLSRRRPWTCRLTFVARDECVQQGHTALHLAAMHGHTPIVRLLLGKMSPHEINRANHVRAPSLFPSYGRIDREHEQRSSDHTLVARDDYVQYGRTALHVAAEQGHTEIVGLVLEHMSQETVLRVDNVRALNRRLPSYPRVDRAHRERSLPTLFDRDDHVRTGRYHGPGDGPRPRPAGQRDDRRTERPWCRRYDKSCRGAGRWMYGAPYD